MYPPCFVDPFQVVAAGVHQCIGCFFVSFRPTAPGGKDAIMKLKYTYGTVTGTTTIEVEEEWVTILEDEDRREYNNDHKETRRHESLYKTEEYGDRYATADNTEGALIATEEAEEKAQQLRTLRDAIKQLTKDQQDLVNKVILGDMTISAYAKQVGISQPAATQRRQTIMRKLKKFF